MQFIIDPYIGAGNLALGMTDMQIAEIMKQVPRKFRKFKTDELLTDAFDICYVYYKIPNNCEAIEFFGQAEVIFMGKNLLSEPYEKIKELFLKFDKSTECDSAGLTSLKYGIGVYAPFAHDEPLNNPEAIIVFEKGYYD